MLPVYTDLAPGLLRQRLVVEGYPSTPISDEALRRYLSQLSVITGMKCLTDPVTHKSDLYGWAGWIHWETSGAHFYAWDQPLLFFSVDIYTCKQFDPEMVVNFTRDYFQTTEITAKDFSSAPLPRSLPKLTTTPETKYTLSESELDALSTRLLTEQPPVTRDDLVLCRLEGTDELSNLGRHIERQVFEEKFNNSDADMRRVYGPYEKTSAFYVVMDQTKRRPIGNLRATRNCEAGILTLREAERYAGLSTEEFKKFYGLKSLDTVWDIGTLAIPKQYRDHNQHHVVAMLYRGAHLRARWEGITHYVALIDRDLYRNISGIGFPFIPIMDSEPFEYEGSPGTTAACGISVDFFPSVATKAESAEGTAKLICSYFWQRFVHGHDVDHRVMFKDSISMWPGGTTPLGKSLEPEPRL